MVRLLTVLLFTHQIPLAVADQGLRIVFVRFPFFNTPLIRSLPVVNGGQECLYNGIKTKGIIPPDPHMSTENADNSGIPFSGTPSAYDDKCGHGGLSSTSGSALWSLTPSQPALHYSNHPFSHGWLAPESFTVHSDSSTHPYLCFPRSGNV